MSNEIGGFETFNIASAATEVPEPSSMLILGVGLIGLTVIARRRTRR
jgi:hypothetical protein